MVMKKRMAGAAVFMMLALLTGCGQGGKSGTADARDYVTPGEYKGIEINIPLLEGEELDVSTAEFYFERLNVFDTVTDRPVAAGDRVNIDYVGTKDGVAFGGGTAEGYDLLIGSGTFIPGFEEGLVGAMPGETLDLNLRFPDAFHSAELAGQEVVFTVTVNYISGMNDEAVAALGLENVANVEQLKQFVRENDYRSKAEPAVIGMLMDQAVYADLPEDQIEESKQIYKNLMGQIAQTYGMDAKSFLAQQGLDYDSTIAQYAENYTKQQLLIRAIAASENMNLSEEDLDKRLNEYAAQMGATVDELLTNDAERERYRDSFLYEDVMEFIMKNVVNTAEK